MKFIGKNTILIFVLISLYGCAEQYQFTDKKNLNNTLNLFVKGEFYACSLEKKNSGEEKLKINKNINLIHAENIIGLIYKSDKWNNGNSIFLENKANKNSYNMTSFYSKEDFDPKILNKDFNLTFDKIKLDVNLFEKNSKNLYSCIKLQELLPDAMKKQMLKNFLLQRNADRE